MVSGASKGIARLNSYNKRLKRNGPGPMIMIPRLDCIEEEIRHVKAKRTSKTFERKNIKLLDHITEIRHSFS